MKTNKKGDAGKNILFSKLNPGIVNVYMFLLPGGDYFTIFPVDTLR